MKKSIPVAIILVALALSANAALAARRRARRVAL